MLQTAREKRAVLLILATILVSVLTGAVMAKRLPFQGEAYENLKVFTEVLSYVEANYVEEVDPEKLVHGAIRGMLRTLDPHSSFMPPDVYREMQVETEGRFGGLGIEITISRDEILTVVAPIEGTPAYRGGIQAGDKIVKINDKPTKGMTLIEVVKTLRGPEGTSVTIGILRKGFTEPRDFTITRAIIEIKSVRWTKMHDDIGYVKLRSFQKTTSEELDEALQDLEEQNIRGLVLDLRNNPGGLLEQAIAVSNEFIEGGKLIVYTKGRLAGQNMKGFSKNDRVHLDYPMVILLNGGSASASEIVAGALQDLERATLIGTQSFGKGSVQTIIPMSNGSGLRLTTAKYYTPKGREINGQGIKPDIIIEEAKPQDDEGPTPLQSRQRPILPSDDLSDDRQLHEAVKFLKMRVKEEEETVKAD